MGQRFLETFPFYPYLKEEEKYLLEKSIQTQHYQAGELIYSPAKNCTGLMRVVSGGIRTYLLSPEGKKATIFRLHEGEFCVLSMSCALSAIVFDVEVEATEDCQLMLIPPEAYFAVEQKNIYVKNFSLELIMDRLSSLIEAIQQLMFLSLEQRLASYLLDESNVQKSDRLSITQEEVAENIGSAREAISRCLKKMKEKNMLSVGRGQIHILDKTELYRLLSK